MPVLLLSLFIIGCTGKGNRHNVDVSDIKVDLSVKRFEKKLFEIPIEQFPEQIKHIRSNYPKLMTMYAENVVGVGPVKKDTTLKLLKQFIYDSYWREVYRKVQKRFKDFSPIQNDLTRAFKHLRYYYPRDTLPEFYTMVKGIDIRYKVGTYPPNKMAIFLDMYLGTDYKYYPSQYPDYRIKQFRKKYLVPDVMETYFSRKFPESEYSSKTFLSQMLYQGKKLYYLKAMMPGRHDTTIIRYDKNQWEWCQTYKAKIWSHFIENDLLYETNANKTDKFFEEGPFTNAGGIPKEAPPRLGSFTGWMIIRQYMQENPGVKLPELMENKQYKQILNQSGYNP